MLRIPKRVRASILAAVSGLILGSVYIGAQITTGDVVGTVTDQTGAAIAAAKVIVENIGTHEVRQALTTTAGDFFVTLLPSGHYAIRIEARGFKTYLVRDIGISAGDRARVDVQMQVGEATEHVEVVARPPALEADSSTLQSIVVDREVQDLPTNGRNFIDLVQLSPGVNQGPPNALSSGQRPDDRRLTSTVVANGQSDVLNDELIDGMDNNERLIGTIGVRPSLDAISEIRVQTNMYSAEVTRTAGAVINIITKSGTDALHGSLYEFLRNDTLDGRNFFSIGRRPEFRQNQFGGSLGGPIVKDKTFFFGDYEGLRIVQGKTYLSTVPTLFEEQNPGNFSDVGGPVIPSSSIDPVALNYFKLYPSPNLPGTSNNFQSNPRSTYFSSTFDAKIDHDFTEKDRFFVRYSFNRLSTVTPAPLPAVQVGGLTVQPDGGAGGAGGSIFAGPSNIQAQNVQLNYVHIFRPNLLLELKGGFTRINSGSFPLNWNSFLNKTSTFSIPGANLGENSSGFAALNPVGYAILGDDQSLPLISVDNVFQYYGTLTYNHGQHSFKFGADLIRRQARSFQQPSPEGSFTFNSPTTGGPSLVNMLMGIVNQESRNNTPAPQDFRTWEPGFYIQDDWRVTRWLTLNLGARYDVFTPFTEAHNRLSNFDINTKQYVLASSSDPTAGIKTDYSNIAPRIGFAASLNKTLVIRGGFSLSFYPTNYTTGAALFNAPFGSSYQSPPNSAIPLSAGIPTPAPSQAVVAPFSLIVAEDFNIRSSYLEQTNVTLQKQIGENVFGIGYVGEFGRHQLEPNPDLSQGPPGQPLEQPFTINGLPYFVLWRNSNGMSNYNAMQLTFERRYKSGLTFSFNYTYAHGLDDSPGISSGAGADGWGQVPSNIAVRDYGNSDLDIRHRFAMQLTYELPYGRQLRGVKGELLKGWQLSTAAFWQTGLPFTVLNNVDVANTFDLFPQRPNQVEQASISNPSVSRFFNTSAFQVQAPNTLGDEGRNPLHGPHQRRVDLALLKNIRVRESVKLQFRVEAFNVSNTPSFGLPSAAINTPAFGTINNTALNIPRQIQLGLKLLF